MDFTPEGLAGHSNSASTFRSEFLEENYLSKESSRALIDPVHPGIVRVAGTDERVRNNIAKA